MKEAVALYDFRARTKRELSFNKGDRLVLYERVSADWWEAMTADDRDGLIPDKYVRIRHRFDDVHFSLRQIRLLLNILRVFKLIYLVLINLFIAFSASMLLVGRQAGHPTCKKLSGGVLAWLSVWSEVQTCIWPG